MAKKMSKKMLKKEVELPRIVIDARMVGPTPHGVARYVSLLAQGLTEVQRSAGLTYAPVFLVGGGPLSWEFPGFEKIVTDIPYLSLRELRELPRVIRKADARLYHSPSFSSLWSCPCPWISTVHDLNHLHFGGLKEKLYYHGVLKPFMRRSMALLTVSEFSRLEIADWLERPDKSIEVVYNAIEPSLREPIPEAEINSVLASHALERGRYFLCVSNSKPHKNVGLLVKAYQEFHKKIGPHKAPSLVLSMKEYFEIPGVKALGPLGDRQTRALLSGAGAIFFPSLYEGFGLPPVEAATLGIPVVASRIPPHQEALIDLKSDEVLWVDPKDQAAWVEALFAAEKGSVPGASPESRQKTLMRYSVKTLGEHMDRIYQRVLGQIL